VSSTNPIPTMDFFDQAKKMVMQSVGLQDTITPDAEFEKWNEHLKRIDGMAVILRRHFNAYANTMVDMVRRICLTLDFFFEYILI
jgi:hypothetical protein